MGNAECGVVRAELELGVPNESHSVAPFKLDWFVQVVGNQGRRQTQSKSVAPSRTGFYKMVGEIFLICSLKGICAELLNGFRNFGVKQLFDSLSMCNTGATNAGSVTS